MHDYGTKEDGKLLIRKLCELRESTRDSSTYIVCDDIEAHVLYYFNRTFEQVFGPKNQNSLDAPGLHIPYDAVVCSPCRFLRVYYVMSCGIIVATVIDTALCENGRCSPTYKIAGVSTHNGNKWGDLLRLQYWVKCGDANKWRKRSGSRKKYLVTKSGD